MNKSLSIGGFRGNRATRGGYLLLIPAVSCLVFKGDSISTSLLLQVQTLWELMACRHGLLLQEGILLHWLMTKASLTTRTSAFSLFKTISTSWYAKSTIVWFQTITRVISWRPQRRKNQETKQLAEVMMAFRHVSPLTTTSNIVWSVQKTPTLCVILDWHSLIRSLSESSSLW